MLSPFCQALTGGGHGLRLLEDIKFIVLAFSLSFSRSSHHISFLILLLYPLVHHQPAMQRNVTNIDKKLPKPSENSFGVPIPDPWTAQSAMIYINEVKLKMLEAEDEEARKEDIQQKHCYKELLQSLKRQKKHLVLSENARVRKVAHIRDINHWGRYAIKVSNILNSKAVATNVVDLRDTGNTFLDSSNQLSKATNEMMQAMVTRVTRVEHRLGILETKVAAIQSTLDSIQWSMDSIESRMDSIELRMESRMDSIELRMESMEKRILTRMEELLNGRN